MERVLSERHKRAEGSLLEAEGIRAAAKEKLQAHADTLKKARAEIFAEQETARRRALEERQAGINGARAAAQVELQAAKKSLAAEVAAARAQLEQSSAVLAGEIAEAILTGRAPAASGSSPLAESS